MSEAKTELDEAWKRWNEWIEEFQGFLGGLVRPRSYILDGTEPVPVGSLIELFEWRVKNPEGHLIDLDERGDASISTVFLFSDHNWSGDGEPILFETMVFGGEHDRHQVRYSTYDEAVRGHQAMCEHVWGKDAHVLEAEFIS